MVCAMNPLLLVFCLLHPILFEDIILLHFNLLIASDFSDCTQSRPGCSFKCENIMLQKSRSETDNYISLIRPKATILENWAWLCDGYSDPNPYYSKPK